MYIRRNEKVISMTNSGLLLGCYAILLFNAEFLVAAAAIDSMFVSNSLFFFGGHSASAG